VQVVRKLRAEAAAVFGNAPVPTYAQALVRDSSSPCLCVCVSLCAEAPQECKYAEAVLKEGMRYYSPVPVFGRHAIAVRPSHSVSLWRD
jgi:cytochrome P450